MLDKESVERLLRTRRLKPDEREALEHQLQTLTPTRKRVDPRTLLSARLRDYDWVPQSAPEPATPTEVEPVHPPVQEPLPTEELSTLRTEASTAETAVAVENTPATTQVTVAELIQRLVAIKDQLSLLNQARVQNPFSIELAQQTEGLRAAFQRHAEDLKAKDLEALLRLVAGQDWLMEPIKKIEKPSISERVQEWCQLKWDMGQEPARKEPPRPPNSLPDGLDSFIR